MCSRSNEFDSGKTAAILYSTTMKALGEQSAAADFSLGSREPAALLAPVAGAGFAPSVREHEACYDESEALPGEPARKAGSIALVPAATMLTGR